MRKKLLIGLGAVLGMAMLAVLLVWAATFTDDDQTDFDAGTYNYTQWDGANSWVECTNTTPNPIWELPDNASSTGWTDMTGNVLLMHMNESSGTIADASGQGNNGTYNGALYSQTGKLNTAIGFDGINDWVDIPDSSSLRVGSDSFSFSIWVYMNAQASMNGLIGTSRGIATTQGWILRPYSERLYFGLRDESTYYGNIDPLVTGLGGNWNYIVGTVDRNTNLASIYYNGEFQESQDITGAGSFERNIGLEFGSVGGADRFTNATIDEVAIFNRALDATEIADHYNSQKWLYTGEYTSSVKDAGGHTSWNNIAWVPERPTYKELPDSAVSETAYTSGNANMTGNVLLMHMNEASGTILDTSGNGNNGTYNGALYSQTGKLNTAIGFDGGNDYIDAGNDASLDITDELTFTVWVKLGRNHANGDTPMRVAAKGETYVYLFSFSGLGNLYTHVRQGDTPKTVSGTQTFFNKDQWYHVAWVIGPSSSHIYLNGVDDTDTDGIDESSAIDTNNDDLWIGDWEGTGQVFNGTLDEVALWDRGLSASEIQDIYKRGALRLKYQVRSGATSPPTGDFIGPDGTTTDYYEWGTTNSVDTPTFNLTNVADNQYFQYKSYFETDDASYSPELKSVTTDYTSLNVAPNTPTNSLPANGATNQSLTPTLTASAFSDPDAGDTHAASQWQITSTSGDYSSPTYDSGTDVSNLTLITIPSSTLSSGTIYYWHVRYQDNHSNWSSYSTEFSFRTSYAPNTPTNSSPSSGALNQKITPTLSSSAFSDSDAGATHTASQWLIRSLSDASYASPVYDSGTDTGNLTSISIPSGNLSKNTTYFWKVRYKDEHGLWSSYSSETAFSTGVVPITVIAIGATEYTAGETARLSVQVTDADGSVVNTATVTINIYSPSGTLLIDGASMTYLTDSNGLYYHDYTIPATIGVYTYDVTAAYNSQTGYSAHTFHVAQFAADITAILEDTGTTLPAQITAVQTDVTAILEDTETTLPAQISGVETKIDTMQTDVTSIKTAVGADEATTLYSKVTGIETYAKRLQAEILNRETSVKSGSAIKVRYRSVSGLTSADRPEVDVFDASNTQRVTDAKMDEIGSTGVYAYSLTLDAGWGTGEFTVVCADTTTGQLDSLTLSVLTTDLADIRSAITDVAGDVTYIKDTQLPAISANIDTLLNEIGTGNITGIKAETDKITSDVLLNIATIDGKVVTVDTVVDAIHAKTDTIDWSNITDIQAQTDKITAGVLAELGLIKDYTDTLKADITTVDGKVVAVRSVADAIQAKTDTIVWGNITGIKAETDKITSDVLLNIATIDGKVVTVDTVVDAIHAKTDTIDWSNITDIQAQTDKITAGVLAELGLIKDYTDTLKADITTVDGKVVAVRSVADAIQAKTDTIVWGNITGIKAETDKITSDVLLNIATIDGKVVTVDTVVDAIHAKTDTIDWSNITDIQAQTDKITTGVLAELGLIKDYTDTLKADITTVDGKVVAVRSVADAIQAKTDTIVWGNITGIKAETDKIASIVAKWGDYKAADIIGYIDNLESRLGTPLDASTADTVFGDIKTLQEKWGSYTSSDLYTGGGRSDTTGGSTVVPYTVGNEVLTAAVDTYKQLDALRAEVRALGKTEVAHDILVNMQSSLNGVNASLSKLEAASTHPLYAQVVEIANQLKTTGIIKGGEKVMSLYEIPAEHAGDAQYLKKKLEELKAVTELSKDIVEEKKKGNNKVLIKTSW